MPYSMWWFGEYLIFRGNHELNTKRLSDNWHGLDNDIGCVAAIDYMQGEIKMCDIQITKEIIIDVLIKHTGEIINIGLIMNMLVEMEKESWTSRKQANRDRTH